MHPNEAVSHNKPEKLNAKGKNAVLVTYR